MRNNLQTVDFDFSPLFRSSVGFDRMMRLMQDVPKAAQGSSYPPYNIERLDENSYRIDLAVAGFQDKDIEIEAEGNQLRIRGHVSDGKEGDYLHKGIAQRDFEQRFHLADHIEVKDAVLENGMLSISLSREVPEQLKPRKVSIKSPKTLLGKTSKSKN